MPRSDSNSATKPLPETETGGPAHELVIRIDRRRSVLGVVAMLVLVVLLLFAGRAWDWIPGLPNPFGEKTIDRSQPVLLESIQDLSRYEAATGNFQVVIDVEKDAKFIPSAIMGERTLFVASGSVDVYVDFAEIGGSALRVSQDKRSVEVRLPRPALEKPNLDNKRTYVFAQQRGIVNQVRDLVGNDPNRSQKLYQLAEQRLRSAAQESGLTARAEQNTRAMLDGLLKSLGFTTVTVTFIAP
jgi:Protein of unknown function (DUF4230)